MLSQKLVLCRTNAHLTQDEIADKLGVSRQAVQKWESGESQPTLDKLAYLSKFYHVTMDYLCTDANADIAERLPEEMCPSYEKIHEWELWSKTIMKEYRQSYDQGRDIEKYEALFREINLLPPTEEKEKICDALFTLIEKLPQRADYPYVEPDTLEAIRTERKEFPLEIKTRNLEDQMLGGWYGRICGCLLGKPVEGIKSPELKKLCEGTNNYPLFRYFEREELTEELINSISFPIRSRIYPKDFREMPSDDDTNYMVIALDLLKRYGRDFKSEDMAKEWLDSQPKCAYCTAERIAFVNLVKGFQPPESGRYKNAYREWIGAQIRGDVFGYVNPTNPEAAAEMAWRDARISHVKNGIYGEMWVSAMIAAAYGCDSIIDIIRRGLAEIPEKSRLYEAIEKICKKYEEGRSAEQTFSDIASRWDENRSFDWCHTVSNAEIVTASLLYGEGDYGKSICLAVSQAFDTDCNGATVGSVLGVMLGFDKIPKLWTDKINDTLNTAIVGYNRVSVREMARQCLKFVNI